MRKIKQKINEVNSSDNGIAVVFVIGSIALLFIFIMGFITNSIIQKKVSENRRALKQARLSAQSALHRVTVAMRYTQERNPLTANFSEIVSHDSDANAEDDPIYYENLSTIMPTVINNVTYNSWYDLSEYDSTDSDHATWQYIRDGSDDNKILSRFAYIVVADKGKLDPSASVDSGVNAYAYNARIHGGSVYAISESTSADSTSVDSDGDDVIGRPGRDISELFLTTLPSWFTDTMAENISADNASPAGTLPLTDEGGNTRWPDFKTMFSEGYLEISDAATQDSFRKVFSLYNPPDPEAYWIDENEDNIKETGELYHRFNLARTETDWNSLRDWNSLSVADIKADPIPFSTTYDEGDVTSIPWLKNWKDEGGMGSVTACKNQIIANLIDYNDTDNEATSDYPDTDPPTYVGLEKVPYINEIRILFDSRMLTEEQDDGTYSYQSRVRMNSFQIELVNIYDTETINTIATIEELSCSYNFYVRLEWGGWDNYYSPNSFTIEDIVEDTWSDIIPVDGNDYAFGDITFLDISPEWENWPYSTSIGTNMSIEDFKITNLKIRLNDESGTLYDYSNILEDGETSSHILSPDGNSLNTYFSIQVNDPRQNLNETDWDDSDFSSTANGTLGTVNAETDPSAGDDPETVDDPKINLSTAYIRNAPMQSPWELGFIHRGAAWQTINLKKYNSTESYLTGGGGDAYSDGDANILDQIKMTSATDVYGKINVNTDNEDVLKVLFEKINVGSDISSLDGPGVLSGTEVDAADAGALALDVLAANGTAGETVNGTPFFTRAQILRYTDSVADVPELWNDDLFSSVQTTDATQEEIIGKFINLTKAVNSNIFTVIVVAQSIKDVGGGITIKKDLNQDGEISVNETFENVQYGDYDQYADEILATQKIMATIQKKEDSNSFRILKFEYIDE